MSEQTMAQKAALLRRSAQMAGVVPAVVDGKEWEIEIDASGDALELVINNKVVGPIEALKAHHAWQLMRTMLNSLL